MKKVLLTVDELAAALQVSVKSIRRAYWKGEIPVKRICRFVRFDLDRVKAAMQRKGMRHVRHAEAHSRRRSATGGESRRRAQQARPRLGKTGASIARKS
ncbi:helix-turn-helix domain-containing protein [Nitrospira sp. Nam80]